MIVFSVVNGKRKVEIGEPRIVGGDRGHDIREPHGTCGCRQRVLRASHLALLATAAPPHPPPRSYSFCHYPPLSDDEYSDSDSEISTAELSGLQQKPKINEEESRLLQILNSWHRSKEGKDKTDNSEACMFHDSLALQAAEKSFHDVLGESYPSGDFRELKLRLTKIQKQKQETLQFVD